jgi:hypothetical protein
MSGDRGWYLVALGILAVGLNPVGKMDGFCLSTLRARTETALLRAEVKADRYFAAALFALTGQQPVPRVVVPQIDVEQVRAQAEQARVMALTQVEQCAVKRQMMRDAVRVRVDAARQVLMERPRLQHNPVIVVGPMNIPEDVTDAPKDDDGTI